MKAIKLAVVGSRTFNDRRLLEQKLEEIDSEKTIICVVSGGARGADLFGEEWAKKNGIETQIFYPDWERLGKKAGIVRNKDIVDNCDELIAFWDGISNGTKSSIEMAKSQGKKVTIVYF